MREMSRFYFLTILLLSLLTFRAQASVKGPVCASLLLTAFYQNPDDSKQGFVTDQVRMSPESVEAAYRLGIFPWAATIEGNARWYNPTERGILLFDNLHISRSDQKFINKALASGEYRITFDAEFEEVMRECAEAVRWIKNPETGERVRKDGRWITPQFLFNWLKLFERGQAHSVEVWHNDILVGGLYGTYIGGVFSGESMFHKEDDVTKLALFALIERLKSNGHKWIDTQMAIGLSQKWGAHMIVRDQFMDMLKTAQEKNLPF